ncbi:histone deacetylation protein Rxt3-domain-containing protein [Gilbertella persicaria]|uniref:histone deacetylation protein Rxt3-domain-containing protein n=1 Tax=Gilbertella persicaria TaxID=101096 RepID=UPI002220F03E|nr:histone deacetylation protein Rxt3-domain-containing protein [Gilbertella persicaria]KAI8092200.1 histone deacetylation protein Rxt3-domain-containing protein [Gilbertella persicaria]
MEENNIGIKRSEEETALESESKRQKLNEDSLDPTKELMQSQLPDTLLLDKDQADTINELLEGSNSGDALQVVSTEQESQEEKTSTFEKSSTEEQKMVSADELKPVTASPASVPESLEKNTAEDNSITSEQLLFALTSVPPVQTNTIEEEEPMQTTEEEIKPVEIHPTEPKPKSEETSFSSTNTTIPSVPLKTTNTNTNTTNNSLSNALNNLPDISAALRRLSSANVSASVIEQLSSSSPRLPNVGHLGERKGSMTDVSPSEILGNALAAVAANAARSNQSSQSQQQPSQPQQSSNAQATATAIGNLAAITANISNLLHSGGFHRNSFSQEDTQKLAAAVARQAQQPTQRRKSSIAAFSTMLDQAISLGRNKTDAKPAQQLVPVPTKEVSQSKPKLIVKNDQVWKSIEGIEEKSLGFQLYSPHLLLPNLENCVNGLMEIRVPARFLTFDNVRVKKRAIWGTDIYTDDSDIVAMAIHSGKYQPEFIEPTVEPGDPFALAIAGKQRESIEAAKKLAMSGKKYVHRHDHLIPDHDLKVTVRVLPTLQSYASTIRNKLKSREWGRHDGMSLFVNKVEKIKASRKKKKNMY